jgi:hypothetical protein
MVDAILDAASLFLSGTTICSAADATNPREWDAVHRAVTRFARVARQHGDSPSEIVMLVDTLLADAFPKLSRQSATRALLMQCCLTEASAPIAPA